MHSNMRYTFCSARTLIIGDASIEQTIADFTLAAKEDGVSQVRIVQSDK